MKIKIQGYLLVTQSLRWIHFSLTQTLRNYATLIKYGHLPVETSFLLCSMQQTSVHNQSSQLPKIIQKLHIPFLKNKQVENKGRKHQEEISQNYDG